MFRLGCHPQELMCTIKTFPMLEDEREIVPSPSISGKEYWLFTLAGGVAGLVSSVAMVSFSWVLNISGRTSWKFISLLGTENLRQTPCPGRTVVGIVSSESLSPEPRDSETQGPTQPHYLPALTALHPQPLVFLTRPSRPVKKRKKKTKPMVSNLQRCGNECDPPGLTSQGSSDMLESVLFCCSSNCCPVAPPGGEPVKYSAQTAVLSNTECFTR